MRAELLGMNEPRFDLRRAKAGEKSRANPRRTKFGAGCPIAAVQRSFAQLLSRQSPRVAIERPSVPAGAAQLVDKAERPMCAVDRLRADLVDRRQEAIEIGMIGKR